MYADPKHIRQNRLNLCLSDIEQRMVDVTAEFCGKQPGVLARELLVEALRALHASESAPAAGELPRTGS